MHDRLRPTQDRNTQLAPWLKECAHGVVVRVHDGFTNHATDDLTHGNGTDAAVGLAKTQQQRAVGPLARCERDARACFHQACKGRERVQYRDARVVGVEDKVLQ